MQNKLLLLMCVWLLGISCAPYAGQTRKLQVGMTQAEVKKIMRQPLTVSAEGRVEIHRYQVDTGLRILPYFVRYRNGRVEAFGHPGDFSTNTFNLRHQDRKSLP